jgi:hypothetical protein
VVADVPAGVDRDAINRGEVADAAPRHDFASHGADGFRTGVAIPYREMLPPKEPQPFKMKTSWPTFKELTDEYDRRMFVPAKYYEKVGQDGFLQKPIGAGPYKLVSHSISQRSTATTARSMSRN